MQELAYSTYCSLKYLSGQGYLFQESHFTIAWHTCRGLIKEQVYTM